MIEKLAPLSVIIETTGADPLTDCIWELALVPLLSSWLPDPNKLPFHLVLVPTTAFEDIDFTSEEMKGNKCRLGNAYVSGVHSEVASSMLERWINANYNVETKFTALGHNVKAGFNFLYDLLPGEQLRRRFDTHYRDVAVVESYLRDKAVVQGEERWSASLSLSSLRHKYGVAEIGTRSAIADAITCARVYNRQLSTI